MTSSRGFTMIEVLIAMVILAIGLLGLAALQAVGMRNNHSALSRFQATLSAYDMADRMRSNSGASGASQLQQPCCNRGSRLRNDRWMRLRTDGHQ